MATLLEVEALPGYRLRLRFSDGVEGTVDLSGWVGRGIFKLWNDPQAFARAALGPSGEVCWNDDVALCGDALYLELTGKHPEDLFPSLRKVTADA